MTSLRNLDCFLLDMDGTIYLGNQLIPGALDLITALENRGKRYYFVTNNSSRSPQDYVNKLSRVGLSIDEDRIITSGSATVWYIKNRYPGARVFLLGTPELARQFTEAGINLAEPRNKPELVVLGFDTTLSYQKLWDACELLQQGAVFIATHGDINCPLEGGRLMPDAGAMIALLTTSTGKKPVVIGKPNRELVDYLAATLNCPPQAMAMVGDRLYTDIAMGKGGLTTVLVLSGETRGGDVAASDFKPDYVFPSVMELAQNLE